VHIIFVNLLTIEILTSKIEPITWEFKPIHNIPKYSKGWREMYKHLFNHRRPDTEVVKIGASYNFYFIDGDNCHLMGEDVD
jgi:hypothetical protein